MKNQYFGDINDYRKYGLLRVLIQEADLKLFISWMLTPDDGSKDGKHVAYLGQPERWMSYDPGLFEILRSGLENGAERNVGLIEGSYALPRALFFPEIVPDSAQARRAWFSSLFVAMEPCDLVFLDPDNGLEVKSRPYGRRYSSKFLYWHELRSIWNAGKSLLVYQHFIRENRFAFVERMLFRLREDTRAPIVDAFLTANVVFLLALQPQHAHKHQQIIRAVGARWSDQIRPWSLENSIPIPASDSA